MTFSLHCRRKSVYVERPSTLLACLNTKRIHLFIQSFLIGIALDTMVNLTWSPHSHNHVPGHMCTFPGNAAFGHRRCGNEDRQRQRRSLDGEGNEDNTNLGQLQASHPDKKERLAVRECDEAKGLKTSQRVNTNQKYQIITDSPQTDGWNSWERFRLWWNTTKEGVCVFKCSHLHRWGEGIVQCDSVHLQTHTYSWCIHPPPSVHRSDTLSPGTNTTPLSLQHIRTQEV